MISVFYKLNQLKDVKRRTNSIKSEQFPTPVPYNLVIGFDVQFDLKAHNNGFPFKVYSVHRYCVIPLEVT